MRPIRRLAPPARTTPANLMLRSRGRNARRVELQQELLAALRLVESPRSRPPSGRARGATAGTRGWSVRPSARSPILATRSRAGCRAHGGSPPDRRRSARSCRGPGRPVRPTRRGTVATRPRPRRPPRAARGHRVRALRRADPRRRGSGAGRTVVGIPLENWIGWSLTPSAYAVRYCRRRARHHPLRGQEHRDRAGGGLRPRCDRRPPGS